MIKIQWRTQEQGGVIFLKIGLKIKQRVINTSNMNLVDQYTEEALIMVAILLTQAKHRDMMEIVQALDLVSISLLKTILVETHQEEVIEDSRGKEDLIYVSIVKKPDILQKNVQSLELREKEVEEEEEDVMMMELLIYVTIVKKLGILQKNVQIQELKEKVVEEEDVEEVVEIEEDLEEVVTEVTEVTEHKVHREEEMKDGTRLVVVEEVHGVILEILDLEMQIPGEIKKKEDKIKEEAHHLDGVVLEEDLCIKAQVVEDGEEEVQFMKAKHHLQKVQIHSGVVEPLQDGELQEELQKLKMIK
jgi:hypothetical protein